jgi:nucleoid DNA-binding protein
MIRESECEACDVTDAGVRKVRRWENPEIRETIQVPAKKMPKFLLSKGLRVKR